MPLRASKGRGYPASPTPQRAPCRVRRGPRAPLRTEAALDSDLAYVVTDLLADVVGRPAAVADPGGSPPVARVPTHGARAHRGVPPPGGAGGGLPRKPPATGRVPRAPALLLRAGIRLAGGAVRSRAFLERRPAGRGGPRRTGSGQLFLGRTPRPRRQAAQSIWERHRTRDSRGPTAPRRNPPRTSSWGVL